MKITDHAEHAEQQQKYSVKEEVTNENQGKKEKKKRKEKGVCAFQNTFTQLWIFGYKVHVFTTATVPVPPPTYPVSGKPMEN